MKCYRPSVGLGFPGGSVLKNLPGNAGDLGSASGLGRSPGGGQGNPLQYSCQENPHEQSSLVGYSPWGCKESDTTEQLSTAHVLAIPKPLSLKSRIEQISKHIVHNFVVIVYLLSSVQLYLTLCDPMDCSTPDFPVHHQLPELAQIHVHQVGDAIQPSYPLSSPSPPAFSLSQHQGLFQWVSSLHQVAKA